MVDRTESYTHMFQDLLPKGQAWNTESDSNLTIILSVMAGEFSKIHERGDDLVRESDPRTTLELLSEWENDYGLPDTCTGAEDTIQERRNALVYKIVSQGGQSRDYFLNLAGNLGYPITIEEFRPFICGASECGLGSISDGQFITTYGITDQDNIRFNWSVTVLEDRVTWFRCGASECGKDPLAKISYAADLECIFRQRMPAHTNLIFSYTGA